MIRRTPIRKKRNKPRPGRLQGADMDALRLAAFERDNGHCIACNRLVIFTAPVEWDNSMHLAHRRGKRNFGDNLTNVQTECGGCHRKFHNYGPSRTKPCAPKK